MSAVVVAPVFTTVIARAVVMEGLANTFIVSRVFCVEKLNDNTTFAGLTRAPDPRAGAARQ
ncbi:MAG: hypothetical protein WDO56_02910 [Gammaproteobacteria bacterium]